MLLIGESLNVISKKIGAAYKQRDPKPIQEEALFQREKGMDYIDINLGPAKKDGHEPRWSSPSWCARNAMSPWFH